MTKRQQKATFKKRLEALHQTATGIKSVGEVSREEERQERLEQDKDIADLKRRLGEFRNKNTPDPVQDQQRGYGPTGIFPMVFLDRCAKLYRDKLITFVEQWDEAAHNYLDWLEAEGFSQAESVELLNAALEQADLDMRQFPVCGQL
jgi:hypothetical protein